MVHFFLIFQFGGIQVWFSPFSWFLSLTVPLLFLILSIWVSLTVLLLFSKKQLFVSLILCVFLFVSFYFMGFSPDLETIFLDIKMATPAWLLGPNFLFIFFHPLPWGNAYPWWSKCVSWMQQKIVLFFICSISLCLFIGGIQFIDIERLMTNDCCSFPLFSCFCFWWWRDETFPFDFAGLRLCISCFSMVVKLLRLEFSF